MNDQNKSIFKPDGKNSIHGAIEHEPSAGKALIDPTDISGCMKNGGAVTINLGIHQDGSVDPRALDVLKEVRQRIRNEQP